jgi:hypothetical protein
VGDIAVTYVNKAGTFKGKLRIDDAGVGLIFGRHHSGSYAWDQVRRISFDDPGRTRASVGAIAVFGVLGLAARKSFSLITISVTDQDIYFTSPYAIGQWRASALRIAEDVPAGASKIYVDGRPVQPISQTGGSSTDPPVDVLEQLRRLGELRDSGVLTAGEFESKKAALLERL